MTDFAATNFVQTRTKILIVDDYAENIIALSQLIEDPGIEILSARTGAEALNLLLTHDFALALLDVQMPEMSGFELARLIRGVKRFKNLPIIFVTAHQRDQKFIFEGYGTGAVDLLFKPLDPHVVRSKVRVFVQLDQQNKALLAHSAELERLKVAADTANRAKSQFVANMSHEIRTPLASVLGFSDVLAQNSFSSSEKEECVQAIRRNGQLLLRLVDDILDLSRIEAQKIEFEKLRFDMREVIKDVESAMSLKAEEKGIHLKFHHDIKDPVFYFSDPSRIKQVLLNVIGNAIKFTAFGGVDVSIRRDTALTRNFETLIFLVEDTGIGLTPQQAERIFEPFSQADASTHRKFGGSGLGLAISKKIALALDGDIQLKESADHQGCAFEISMVLERDPLPVVALPQSLKGLVPEINIMKDKKILVVDDAKDNRVLAQMYLRNTGVQVFSAESGKQAIECVKFELPDVILMDIQMPEMDGYEATREIRALGYRRPIIALTAHAMPEERTKCQEAGCNFVLTKPIKRKTLIEALNSVL